MKTTASLVAFAASAAAQQFVLYATADKAASQRADPIITPGELSGHVHDFLGAGSMAPELSYEALQDTDCTTVGANDGSGNAADNSVYWHPALYAKKKDGSGYMKIPTVDHKMYYRKPAAKKYREPFEFPQGFRMIAGDPFRRAANDDSSTNSKDITSWKCHGPDISGEDGGFPSLTQACGMYPSFMGTLHFPHCWNGNDFDQSDPGAHMAYPLGNIESGDCPDSHPTALPHIFMENNFEMTETFNEIDPDTLTLAQGDGTGYGWHADFFNGWVDGALPELFDTCPQGEYGNHNVGDCPSYKPYSKSASECKLKNYFEEETESPGENLVGCNPLSTVNPAPRMAVAELGSAVSSCANGVDLGSGLIESDDSDYSSSSGGVTSSPAEYYASEAAPSTTFATATSVAVPVPSYGAGDYVGAAEVEEDEDEEDVVYVTEWVTATAVATAYAKRDGHRHNHMHVHNRRNL